jgi:hypothetical protein
MTVEINYTDDRFKSLFSEVDKNLFKKFFEFHFENPGVYDLFEKFALQAKAANRPRFSHWMIAQRIRWYTNIETTGTDYKLSNDYIAMYARLLVYAIPELEGFFQLKKMKSCRKSTVSQRRLFRLKSKADN